MGTHASLQTRIRKELFALVADDPQRAHYLGIETEPLEEVEGCELYWRDARSGERGRIATVYRNTVNTVAWAVLWVRVLRVEANSLAEPLLRAELDRRNAEGQRRKFVLHGRRLAAHA